MKNVGGGERHRHVFQSIGTLSDVKRVLLINIFSKDSCCYQLFQGKRGRSEFTQNKV